MEKIPFKVSARAGKLLGRENFSNPEGAIIELVKNSYDADAKNCFVVFNIPFLEQELFKGDKENSGYVTRKIYLYNQSEIYIIDNGEGMTKQTIENHWMQIGTGNKEENYKTKDNRIKTGAKGIGRFALDRLGFSTEMWTLSKESKNRNGLFWKMDWNQFDDSKKTISQIEADIDDIKIDFTNQVKHLFLNNEKFHQAYKEAKFNNGTLIKITNLKDDWDERNIKNVFKSLEALIPPKQLNIPFEVYFNHFQQPKLYGKVETAFFNDFDYKLTAKFDADNLDVKFEITRNELDIDKIKTKFSSVLKGKQSPFDLTTLEKRTFKYNKSIDKVLKWELTDKVKQQLKEVGSFDFTFFYLKLSSSKKEGYPYKSISVSERRATLKRFGGVKIYRDSFRVRPYGDPNNDWLRLGYRAAQSPAGPGQRIGDWRVRPESTAGLISISRLTNPKLVDKADRNALQENDVFETFKNIIVGIIHEFEFDRTKILNPFYLYLNKLKEEEKEREINRRAKILADKIVADRKKREEKTSKTKQEDLFQEQKEKEEKESIKNTVKETIKEIEDEFLQKENEEIVQVRALASLGLIVTSFAHELNEIKDNSAEIYDLEKIYKKLIQKTEKKSKEYIDGINILDLLKDNDKRIKHWVDYSLTAIKKDKRKRGSLKFSKYFEKLRLSWEKVFTSKDINFKIIDNVGNKKYDFRAFEMDMNTLFTNLINNSIDSFNRLEFTQKREISITYGINKDRLIIDYSDNAKGLDSVFEDKEDIFLPFTTTKKDKHGKEIGTGLGMYLVKEVIDDNNGKIEILTPKLGFELKITFPLRK